MDRLLSKVLKDQQERLKSVQARIGDPGLTGEQLVVLNNNALAMKLYIDKLEWLNFDSFEDMEKWV